MASQLNIEIEGIFPVKRIAVKTTPSMSLNEVLRTTVEKGALNPAGVYALKHGKTQLDLTLSVRFANLPAGAKLVLTGTSPAASSASKINPTSTNAATNQSTTTLASKPIPAQMANIALQIEDGPRIVRKFPTTSTLWDVLKTIETENSLNLTKRLVAPPPTSSSHLPKALQQMSDAAKKLANEAKLPVYSFPLLILVNKEYLTFSSLKSTSLEACGLRGGSNTSIRLLWKIDSNVGWESVKGEVDAAWVPVSEVGGPVKPASAEVKVAPTAAPSSVDSKPTISNAMDVDVPSTKPVTPSVPASSVDAGESKMEVEKETNVSDGSVGFDRSVKVYAPPPEGSDGPMNIQLPETFFQLSPTELKMAYMATKAKSKQLEEGAPLMTKAMRDAQEELRMKKHPKTMIRVRFPDRVTLQMAFLSTELVSQVYATVTESLRTPTRKFMLYTTPPLQNLDSKKDLTFWKAGLAPATLVYFKWDDGQTEAMGSPLNDEYLQKLEELPVPPSQQESLPDISLPVEDEREAERLSAAVAAYAQQYRQQEQQQQQQEEREAGNESGRPEKKVPKWFKLGKK
ncbi:GLUT4 regulating protein TUG-domain-containing protein [Chytriomyces cf. hyalinus JEL632]|nr:GLUT4 regulating protein TUG-domain-containing protein [Chytriomyces cf. hyalinus JEL632]